MLLDLQVKNLALIEKAAVSFSEGLNILTGETGAGKSIIIGSVNMALGGKASKDMIRQGADYALVELVFSVDEEEKRERLKELDVELSEDGTLIISKKIMPSRSVSKVNDETVTAGRLKEITSLLIDIHGQHEHQSLLYKSKHLQILDSYVKSQSAVLKEKVSGMYHKYQELLDKLEDMNMDRESRLREADFLRYEIEELDNAKLREGEEEELTASFRRLVNAQKIMESLSAAYQAIDGEGIGTALKQVAQAAEYDESLAGIRDQLFDAEAILSDVAHDITGYMDEFSFDQEQFEQVEKRLDFIHNLQAKYGNSVGEIKEQLEKKRKRLEELDNFDLVKQKLEKEFEETRNGLEDLCGQLSKVRKKAARALTKEIRRGLEDLNFIDVQFEMEFRRLKQYTAGGYDEAEFLISTNPGLPVQIGRAHV